MYGKVLRKHLKRYYIWKCVIVWVYNFILIDGSLQLYKVGKKLYSVILAIFFFF